MPTPSDKDRSLAGRLRTAIDGKTKPTGSLGRLETTAFRIGMALGRERPRLTEPQLFVFAADHGIARHGTSAYPPSVTVRMVANFLAGGAAVSVFCRRHGLRLRVVDAGTAQPPAPHPDLIDARVGAGTADILEADAMTQEQLDRCFAHGRRVVAEHVPPGGNVLALGEMGIGNSGAAALLTAGLTGAPLDRCIGPGTGLAGEGLVRKRRLLAQAAQARGGLGGIDPRRLLQRFGGFEIAQMTAAFLEGGRRGMLLLVDGFIAAAAFLAAERLAPGLRRRAVFCHASAEPGARLLLHALEAEPLLDLGLRLGEGSGCALAFPLVQSAADFLTDMAAFEEAGIDRLDPHR